jgi:hypothetical protein
VFKTRLKVELINNEGKKWKLLEDLVYEDKEHGRITVPSGFETDFASVPRIPVVFELVGDRGHAAATLHDWLYHNGDLTRKEVDAILLQALRDTKVGKFRSYLMYFGVRGFGWMFFKK